MKMAKIKPLANCMLRMQTEKCSHREGLSPLKLSPPNRIPLHPPPPFFASSVPTMCTRHNFQRRTEFASQSGCFLLNVLYLESTLLRLQFYLQTIKTHMNWHSHQNNQSYCAPPSSFSCAAQVWSKQWLDSEATVISISLPLTQKPDHCLPRHKDDFHWHLEAVRDSFSFVLCNYN